MERRPKGGGGGGNGNNPDKNIHQTLLGGYSNMDGDEEEKQ